MLLSVQSLRYDACKCPEEMRVVILYEYCVVFVQFSSAFTAVHHFRRPGRYLVQGVQGEKLLNWKTIKKCLQKRNEDKGLKSVPGAWKKLANQQNRMLPVGYKSNYIVNDNSVTARHNRAKIWKWLSGKRKGTDDGDMGAIREIYWAF